MAKEKQMTLITANVYSGDKIVGTLTKEVPDYAVEQEFQALLIKVQGMSADESAPSGIGPVVVE